MLTVPISPRSKNSTVGVLLAQLGTPEAPTAEALRPYLLEFLSDRRVIDYSPFYWQPILRGFILPRRPARSARLYSRIWTDDGSPLMVFSRQQVEALQTRLGDGYHVKLGMRYGAPAIDSAMKEFEAAGIDRIVVLPMYPQFSSTTTASIYDAVFDSAAGDRSALNHERKRFIPTLRFIEPYYDHPGYIESMADHLRSEIAALPYTPDMHVVTFHGILNRYVQTGDPYRSHCEATAALLAQEMGWRDDEWTICFQSRFGREPWLEPYTDETLESLHHRGVERPVVFSPGFTTDCLETLDELGNEGRDQFAEGGGNPDTYTLLPCLNVNDDWMDVLAGMVRVNAYGWVVETPAYAV